MENYNIVEKDFWKTYYYLNDKLHRIDGPAIEHINGTKNWYQNGKCHRLDGSAIEGSNGYKAWLQNGLLHRIDGPAKEYVDGYKEYWIEGTLYSKEEFDKQIALLNKSNKIFIIFVK
jgi:hypothetical protein